MNVAKLFELRWIGDFNLKVIELPESPVISTSSSLLALANNADIIPGKYLDFVTHKELTKEDSIFGTAE